MRRDCIQILVACTILSMGRPAIRAAEFAGGKGEPNDPYLIATAEQLIAIGSDSSLLSKHFLMVHDVDLDPNLSAAYAFDQAVIGGGFRVTVRRSTWVEELSFRWGIRASGRGRIRLRV